MFAEYGVLNYWTYLVGAIFIVLVPGPNTLFVLKNSVSSGMKGGYLAACGVFIGDAVLMFLAWAGVATLIKTTPILFNIVRYLGAFYLLYLGSKILYATLKGKNSEAKSDEPQYGAIFKRALILSLTNPKAINSGVFEGSSDRNDENMKMLKAIRSIVGGERGDFIDKIIIMYNDGAFDE